MRKLWHSKCSFCECILFTYSMSCIAIRGREKYHITNQLYYSRYFGRYPLWETGRRVPGNIMLVYTQLVHSNKPILYIPTPGGYK